MADWTAIMRIQVGLTAALLAACAPSSSAGSQQDRQRAPTSEPGRPFTITEVARFSSPWAMAFLPGSGLPLTSAALVTEREGRLWLVDTSRGSRQPVSGVPAVRVGGQGGLGDVVPHPDFAGNRRIYLSFVEAGPGGTSGAAVGYGTLELGSGAPRLAGFRVIWRQMPKVSGSGHFSHRIAFATDGSMFISSGDRQKMEPAQDLSGMLGKIVRLTAEGGIPGDNPLVNVNAETTDRPEIWTSGHRNVLGLAFAPDGRLWATEMGARGGDELNLIVKGRNYGWPRVSYGSHYSGQDIPDDHRGRGFEEPKAWWTPSVSPGGLLIYRGRLFPNWRGDALIPALSGQALIRVDIDGDRARKAEQWDMGRRIRSAVEGPRGEIYLLVDEDSGGQMLRLEPRR